MVSRRVFVVLCVAILSAINGCAVDPSRHDIAPPKVDIPEDIYPRYRYREERKERDERNERDDERKYKVYIPPEPSPLYDYREKREEIDYERQIDEGEQQYRQRRSVQEQEQERSYQQWQQERARERDPRWEWQR